MTLGRANGALLGIVLCAALSCQSLPVPGAKELPASFEGNRHFSIVELSNQIAVSLQDLAGERDPRAAVEDAAFDIEVFHREAGFATCRVEWSVEGRGEAARARFVIHEGPRVTIAKVELPGRPEDAPPAKGLAAFLGRRTLGFFGAGEALFVEADVVAGVRGIEASLRERGWLEAAVAEPEIEFDPSGEHAMIRVLIEAGPRYRLAAMPEIEVAKVETDELDTKALTRQCEAALDENKKWSDRIREPYDPRWASELRGALLDALARGGHPDAQVEIAPETAGETPERRDVRLHCKVQPGPLVRVRAVRFQGNEETHIPFLQSRLGFEAPGTFDGEAIDDGVRRLHGTGLFRTVTARLEGEGEERELMVDVEEGDTREIFIEPGYGSYELLRVRTGVREKNLWGTGRELRAEAKVAVRAQEFEIGLRDPWFLHTALSSDLSTTYERREEPSFTSTSRGAAFLLTHQPGEKAPTTSFGYQFRHSDLESETIDETELEALSDDIDIASLRVVRRYDTVGYLFQPSSGHLLELGLEYGAEALGSELDFLRATGTFSLYPNVGDTWVAATSLRAGWITPLADDVLIPLQERFFNGGENSVRSFHESELGPKDDEGDPLGGEGFGTLNLELRRSVWKPELELAFFADAGYVVPDHRDFFAPTSANTGTALGVGLRYWLPIGPLRLDLGFNPDREDDEDAYVLHFSIGMAF